ncbi:chromosome segregation protein SMC [Barrientosiimonas endolithica]|uniref:Chromosome partition protein Smc n=1 Tax=Barrientosiimonas endolithica TaxID=1535208 RepID=A0ABM8HCJ2_9MICO|nr:chromosome segregation protein SMC [Barrientosiimonas endolithica]BDZ58687.1 chromosome partition protein Smc [Barrientosiimonas endolithica]
MYVKSLTLKGFKSFASATSMTLEPGITCIVGPNGSGKSNVVDALAWVMGEQGAKSLRGGKMEDVIFAGTPNRPPLGRAEVTLTIDNTDGALPIDYTEVTISRAMFRNGGSEYRINGTVVRLLDVQELLSDSGIGREMHVIVGQGQLDTVLRATPEERRGFIEEAAGVLKHRKRKEKALRKLESMEGDLNRLRDLVDEIRRQLGPLGRQAETARRAASIQADVRDARLRLLADDLVQLTSTLEQEVADETAMIERRTRVETELARVKDELSALERQAERARPALAQAQEQWYALGSLKERLGATASLAAERVRLLATDDEQPTSGRDPEQLKRQAADLRAQEQQLQATITGSQAALQAAVEARGAAEKAYDDEQRRIAQLARAAADRREGLAKLQGQVAARRSRIEAGEAEIGRLRERIGEAQERAAVAERKYAELEGSIADTEAGEVDLDERYEQAVADLEAAEAELAKLQDDERGADRDRSSHQARVEALELSLRRKDGAATLLERRDEHGVRGSVSGLVRVADGHEAALAAALGWAAEAVVVDDLAAATSAVDSLRDDEGGRVVLLVGETAHPVEPDAWPSLPAGCTWARDVVEAPDGVRAALDQLLDRVALVPDATTATGLLGQRVTAVTPDGDVYAPGVVRGGSADAPSLLEIQSAVDDARKALADATGRKERAQFQLGQLRERVGSLKSHAEAALDELNDSDAKMSAVAEQLGQLGQTVRSAGAEQQRFEQGIQTAETALEADRGALAELEQRLAAAEQEPADEEPTADEREQLAQAAARARTHETDQRLALRTQEEQARSLAGRASSLESAVRSELEAREKAQRRRERRHREAQAARAVRTGATYSVDVVAQLLEIAAERRSSAEQAQAERQTQMSQTRSRMENLTEELRELTDTVHRDEIARAEQRLRIEALQTKAVEELGIDPEVLTEEYGPHQLVPHVPGPDQSPDDEDFPEPIAFVREAQEKRLRSAERKLNQLGKVNPLALEEFAALEERHKFLTEQLDDLRRSREDLLDIVTTIDERVKTVFADAFADTATQFEGVFSRLFPGGEGRLVLTEPGDMLTTGIEVEARPPGKKIKRLSLLSGGERSLVAVALLVSIFKARPSPFYIMDEVEAALDDANLGRLITLFEELRDSSQLIVITHQKRTMEVADALYGVSMRGDGVTTVVSQRLRDVADDGGDGGPGDGGGAREDQDVAAAS